MKKVRVFAPASIANLGCGFDVMGLALDEVGDILEMTATEGDGITITNRTDVPLPEDIEENVITPVIRKFFEMTGLSGHIDVVICQKIYPGSGIGSSAAAAYGMNELFDCPLSDEEMVICAMEGENLASGGYRALKEGLREGETGFFCETAHPAKFKDTVERIIGRPVSIPDRLAAFMQGEKQAVGLPRDFSSFKRYLLSGAAL